MSTLLQSKADLRKLALSRRNALSEEERAERSGAICEKVVSVILSEVFLSNAKKNEVEGSPEELNLLQAINLSTSNPPKGRTGYEKCSILEILRLHSNTPCSHSAQDDELELTIAQSFTNPWQEFRTSATDEKVCGSSMRSDTSPAQKVEFKGLTIALYDAINSEVDLSPLANRLQQEGVTVLKPLMSDTEGHMEFVNWDEKLDPLSTVEASTIHFPTVPPEEIGIIVCPVVAFDKRNNRLGYGGGYYDRYLPSLKSDTLKIGVAFSCQELDEIPIDDFDVPLDLMVTENS